MAAPLSGLTGLYGPSDNEPHGQTGRDRDQQGTPADPRHAVWGDASHELPYAGTAYAPELPWDQSWDSEPDPGQIQNTTPTSHAAPYPRGVEEDLVTYADQMGIIHGLDQGGPARLVRAGEPYPTHVDSGYHDSPDRSGLATDVPGQLRSGKDLDQGYGRPNGHGFNLGHAFRRWFKDPVPLDRTLSVPAERPFYGKHPVWQARYDGPDSPYGAAGDTSQGMAMADTPYGYPTAYQGPRDPVVLPTTTYADTAPLDDYGWV
jgi:hypothetical protein